MVEKVTKAKHDGYSVVKSGLHKGKHEINAKLESIRIFCVLEYVWHLRKRAVRGWIGGTHFRPRTERNTISWEMDVTIDEEIFQDSVLIPNSICLSQDCCFFVR